MTNNTIPNVPRELLERVLDYDGAVAIRQNARHELRAILSAPSPAGVDGVDVVAWRIGFPNNTGYKVYEQRQPWAYEQYGVPSAIVYEVQELCRLSDAQAIIDGLRAEVGAQRVKTCAALKARNDAHEERDQQAQRTGELEGLLRDFAYHTQRREMPTESSLAEWADRIDAALSAGKEGE